MSIQAPPSLPDPNSALRTYLRAAATLVPTLSIWLFAHMVLVPKLEKLWRDTGLAGSRAQWLMDVSDFFHNNFSFIVAGVLGMFVLVELRWAAWPRYRRGVVAAMVVFFHTAVLVGITTVATAALLAAPLLRKHP